MGPTEKRRGYYLGTEVNEKWWRRYFRGGFFARGIGEYWMDDTAVFFRRYLTKIPIVISFRDIVVVKRGAWHAGRWAGGAPVVKILWKSAGKSLSSGFVFSRDARETDALVRMLRAAASSLKNN